MEKLKLTEEIREVIEYGINDEYSEYEIETNLSNLLDRKVSWYDGGIDDGCDDDEDNYVMKSCFEVENSNIRIRVYYGDCTLKIGYVEITDY